MEENNNNVIKDAPKGSYISGIIGALIGGAIATVPWVLVYVECNYILSALAILIAFGALKGYELCKGKMTKLVKPIIAIISVGLVIFATAEIIPRLLADKNDVDFSTLYDSKEFVSAITQDIIVSTVFAILGVSAAFPSINRKLIEKGAIEADEVTQKQMELMEAQVERNIKGKNKEELEIVRKAFKANNALDRDNTIEKEKIIQTMNCLDSERIFNKFLGKGIIQKYNNQYYYNKANEISLARNNYGVAVAVIVLIVIGVVMAGIKPENNGNNSRSYSKNNSKSSVSKPVTKNKEFNMQDFKFSLSLTSDWTKEDDSDYENITSLNSNDDNSSIRIISTSKEDLADITLDEFGKTLEEYVYEIYDPEEKGTLEKVKTDNYDAYTVGFNTVYRGTKLYIKAYCIETENYFIEFYAVTLRSKYKDFEDEIQKAVNTFKEIDTRVDEAY
ncbi:MAG: hypothetical protein HFJ45_07545 [Clostridia bacterium]|nr:hypothetical protein [Clostridia bacterium]